MRDDTPVRSVNEDLAPPRQRKARLIGIFSLVAVLGAIFILYRGSQTVPSVTAHNNMPRQVKSDGFVSSQACEECHESQHASWHATYHRTMTQIPSPEAVAAPFNGEQVEVEDVKATFTRQGDDYFARFETMDDAEVERQILMTTGSHFMQVCWMSTGWERQLEMVPFAYLKEDQRWIPRRAAFLQPPGAEVSFETGRWNRGCMRCHTTHGVPGVAAMQMDTRVAEFGIGCEACHGPGENHIRFYKSGESPLIKDDIVNPSLLSHERSSQVCGRCHLVSAMVDEPDYLQHGFSYQPGDDLEKSRNIGQSEFGESHFWPDGMVRTSGREFNAVRASPCFQHGELSCLSCHSMHQSEDDSRDRKQWANGLLQSKALGNGTCLQCHTEFESTEKRTEHTHHVAGSDGSLCYNCHMPYTMYGLLKTSRNHQINSPNVHVTLDTGRPNACNLCHLDKSLGWTAYYLQNWYDITPPKLNESQQHLSAALQWLLSGDAAQRALLAWHMGWQPAHEASGNQWIAPHLAQLLEDPYDAIRYIAQRSLAGLPGFGDFLYDFLASGQDRTAARMRAVELWSNMPKAPPFSPESVLLDENGNLREQEQRKLLDARSDRPVRLVE